jgi:anti-sigma B factor antagonist
VAYNQLFSHRDDGQATVFELTTERIDASVARDLKVGLQQAIVGQRRVVIDMAKVSFIDSSGLGALVSVRKSLGEAGEIQLKNTGPFVSKVLRLTKLDQVFNS